MTPYQRTLDAFLDTFGYPPHILVRSPGRINLLGEHTDYNGGPVLPAAVDRAIWLAAAPRTDGQCRLWACDYDEGCAIEEKPSAPLRRPMWADYLLGALLEVGWPGGLDVAFGGNLPISAGVSSSAALENAMALAANALFSLGLSPLELVQATHRAENRFVGVPCGVMDMFAGMMGRKDAFLQLDCRALTWEYLPFAASDWGFVLCHSGVERRLATSDYGARRQECAQGLTLLQHLAPSLGALSEATPSLLEAAQEHLPPAIFRRCRYVIGEVARVSAAAEALRHNNMEALGTLLMRTHEALRDDFEVSCPALDFLVEQALHHPGCAGARLMGAGFGGCTLNLVRLDEVEAFAAHLKATYLRAFGRTPPVWIVRPDDGAEVVFLK